MKLQTSAVRNSLFLVAALLAVPAFRAAAQTKPDTAAAAQAAAIPARITQAIDETQLVRLQGNVHPLARAEFDRGIVSDATPMKRMMLVLQRSPEQQAALGRFMDEQLSKDSPNFHKWLTPEQFGKEFGPADADIQTVTDWLTRQGFQGIKVGAGRTAVEFSGNVGQVRNAFHTEIHQFNGNAESRQANVSDPQIPVALTPVVAGVLTLHNFPRKSMRQNAGTFTRTADGRVMPQFTGTGGNFYAVGPADFAKIYNIPASLDGTGQTIAIVGDSNINPQDVTNFRNLFSLPANPPIIIVNGPDPGLGASEGEADLDLQVSGMVAPRATIDFVVSEDTLTALGIDLSSFYIIDNNLAPVMSLSFGACETALGSTGNQFFNTLWEQAAAQGITVFVSAGDPGSAGCDNFNTAFVATHGLAVSGFASTPFNVAVGGTDFDDFTTQTTFWNPTNSTDGKRESALGYIHEIPWNDSCAATATSSTLNTVCAIPNTNPLLNIVGGSGGPSSVYPKPAWQNGIIPNGIAASDNHRYIPDVSLFASDGPQSKSFYLICQADAVPAGNPPSCVPGPNGFSFGAAGGTSASSPAFAAIMALINQNNGRQGNANSVLYKIAATAGQSCNSSTTPLTGSATCSFYDITKGNNSVPCAASSANCSSTTTGTNGVLVSSASSTTPAWTTATGYDLATGLGSVNVANLATQWPIAAGKFAATTTSLTVNGGTSTVTVTHGTAVTAKVTVAPSSGTGTPTGDVALLAPTTVNGGIGDVPLSGGIANITGIILPGGSYNLNARYAGDTTFASSTSTPGVPVVVGKEPSRLQYSIVTFDSIGNILSTNATSLAYGSPYILRMDILNGSTNACQPLVNGGTKTGCAFDATGTVTITDNGSPLDTGTFKINSAGSAEDQPIQLPGGTHALSATYSGDISYNPVASPVTDTVTVSKATTTTALVASPTSVAAGTNVTLTATISSASNSAVGATGTVTFFNGGTQIGSPVNVVPAGAAPPTGAGGTAALTTSFSSTGTKTITATYNGDTNYALSSPTAITVTVTSSGSFTVGGTAVTVTAGAGGTSTITVTPTGGFTGNVNVTCPAAALPAGATCSPNPLPINVTGTAAVTGSLTVNVTAPSTTLTAAAAPADRTLYAAGTVPPGIGKGWWTLSAGTGLAAMFLLFLPGRKRYRAALGLGLVCMLTFTLGCSSGYGGGGGGPVATTTKLTVNAAKLASSDLTGFRFSINVTASAAPNGQVQLFDGTATLGPPVTVSNGSATIMSAGLLPGTHSISAHYLGDTYTQASSSGTLNVTSTGTTMFAITASPAASNGSPTVNITIN
jgi:hypothetical protein